MSQGHPGWAAHGIAYMDGRYLPMTRAKVSIATHAFNYGTGCFEGIRGYWNDDLEQLFLVKLLAHYERMERSARLFRITLPNSAEELAAMTVDLVRRNEYRQDIYVRPIAYKASPVIRVGLLGLKDGFCCFTAPMGDYHDIEHGLSVTVSGWRRNDDNAIPARAKATGGYVNAALAVADAQDAGFDEAILLTTDGHVSEASAANLFLVEEGRLVTPASTEDILVGITRDCVIEVAGHLAIQVDQRGVDRSELYMADELFLCGTGVQVAPVTKVDGRPVGTGKVGEITRAVQDAYLAAVHGESEAFRTWLTPAYPGA